LHFELSEDQVALQSAAADLLDGLASPEHVRAVVDDGGGVDRALWSGMSDQGWTAVEVPEADGGLGLGAVEVAVLAEQIGRHVGPAPFVPSVLARDALRSGGDDERARRVATGTIACVAWSREPTAVRAVERSGQWTLTGRPDPTVWAPSASVAVVVASTGDERALFALDVDHPPEREAAMDRTRELGWLELDGVAATRLGGADAVERLGDRGATFTAAELLGASSRALELAVEYAKDRVQFGRPIGSFQAVKHRCADMLVDVEGMRSAVYWAAWCVGADDPERSIASSSAKLWTTDASKRVMSGALQVHGGIGFTWEHDLHLFMKRAQLDQVSFGDAAFHRDRLAAQLRAKVAAGESVL